MTPAIVGWSLAAIGAAWGLLTWFVFHRFTDHAALRAVRRRAYAYLMEIRLYSEEPALVWNAQKDFIVCNARILALLAKPVLIMALLFALLYEPLDSVYGWSPLATGHSAVVTVQMSRDLREDDARLTIQAPAGVEVETPPVRVFAERQLSWRIRPQSRVRGVLRVLAPGRDAGTALVTGSIAAGQRTLAILHRRQNSNGAVWMEVDYPRATVDIAGLSLAWLVWFLAISSLSAALFAVRPRKAARRGPRDCGL